MKLEIVDIEYAVSGRGNLLLKTSYVQAIMYAECLDEEMLSLGRSCEIT